MPSTIQSEFNQTIYKNTKTGTWMNKTGKSGHLSQTEADLRCLPASKKYQNPSNKSPAAGVRHSSSEQMFKTENDALSE
jgi:hypothetical protein